MESPSQITTARMPIDKLWAWLEAALEDIEVVRQTKGYQINMRTWLLLTKEQECYACLAGSVMLRRLGVDVHAALRGPGHAAWVPADVPLGGRVSERYLNALNQLRNGRVRAALCCALPTGAYEIVIPPAVCAAATHVNTYYQFIGADHSVSDWEDWHIRMQTILKWLKEIDQ